MWKLITLVVLLSLEIAFAGGELLCSIFHSNYFLYYNGLFMLRNLIKLFFYLLIQLNGKVCEFKTIWQEINIRKMFQTSSLGSVWN